MNGPKTPPRVTSDEIHDASDIVIDLPIGLVVALRSFGNVGEVQASEVPPTQNTMYAVKNYIL